MKLKMWNSQQKIYVCRIFQSQTPKSINNIRSSIYMLSGKQHSTMTNIIWDPLIIHSNHPHT